MIQYKYPIDEHNIKKASSVLRALKHKLRNDIMHVINQSGSITVTELYINLKLEQSVASQHLAILRHAGIVIANREGHKIYYTLDKKRISSIEELAKSLGGARQCPIACFNR